jgi:hypothetical protein
MSLLDDLEWRIVQGKTNDTLFKRGVALLHKEYSNCLDHFGHDAMPKQYRKIELFLRQPVLSVFVNGLPRTYHEKLSADLIAIIQAGKALPFLDKPLLSLDRPKKADKTPIPQKKRKRNIEEIRAKEKRDEAKERKKMRKFIGMGINQTARNVLRGGF